MRRAMGLGALRLAAQVWGGGLSHILLFVGRCWMEKTIWMLWLQGWENAPPIVRACLTTWAHHNPDWRIQCIDARSIDSFLGRSERISISLRYVPAAARSDLLRIALLWKFGGVWVDATVYCLKPLDEWLPDAASQGFFAFDTPGPDRMIASWFLAAEASNEIVLRWYQASQSYWRWRFRRHHYFWFHYLFADIYRLHAGVKEIWDATPKISADLPHYMTPYKQKLPAPLSPEDAPFLDGSRTPLLKLTHKIRHGGFDQDSRYSVLLQRAQELGRQYHS